MNQLSKLFDELVNEQLQLRTEDNTPIITQSLSFEYKLRDAAEYNSMVHDFNIYKSPICRFNRLRAWFITWVECGTMEERWVYIDD